MAPTDSYYYNLIHNERELSTFYEQVLPPLAPGEVYFLSLSARAKYLTAEEREALALGRTEMFCRAVVRKRELDRFVRTVRKFEVAYGGYTTKNGSNIPDKSIVVYININPSHTLKAYAEFQSKMTDYIKELGICAQEGRKTDDITYRINKMDTLMMNCYQRNAGTKHWLDVDFDIDKSYFSPVVIPFLTELDEHGVRYVTIETHGGYHVMLHRSTINYNYNMTIQQANEALTKAWMFRKSTATQQIKDDTSSSSFNISANTGMEIVVNKNDMVPLPGTFQGGFPVRVLWEYSTYRTLQADQN
jgi:hypothetical protein